MCIVWMDGMGEDIEVAHTAGTKVCKVLGVRSRLEATQSCALGKSKYMRLEN